MTKEDKEILKNCWVMTTDHTLDEEDCKLKNAITNVLNEMMTPEEKVGGDMNTLSKIKATMMIWNIIKNY